MIVSNNWCKYTSYNAIICLLSVIITHLKSSLYLRELQYFDIRVLKAILTTKYLSANDATGHLFSTDAATCGRGKSQQVKPLQPGWQKTGYGEVFVTHSIKGYLNRKFTYTLPS